MSHRNHLKWNKDLFANIPSEIIIQILSILPVRSIITCKRVCKLWLAILQSSEFVKIHLLNAIPGLAVCRRKLKLYEVFEFEDGLNLQHHKHHYKSVIKFNTPYLGILSGSANGLLFLCNMYWPNNQGPLYVCNPITRDYIELDCPSELVYSCPGFVNYGFGVSKISGQHKVVRIYQEFVRTSESSKSYLSPKSECVCHVYTIGTGLWRRITSDAHHDIYETGTFLNGNLHWLLEDVDASQEWISCFDLETEQFSTFPCPFRSCVSPVGPTVLEGCLCLSDNDYTGGMAIWLMKDYGVEESWTMQYFIGWNIGDEYLNSEVVSYPIKVFKDGDILMAWKEELFFYYKKTDTVHKLRLFKQRNDINEFLYTPSFLSLKSFGTEKVISF